jgi:GDP-4-dehydro-6-deoxy-D-mannose reductase
VAGSFASQVAEIEAGLRDPIIEVGNIDLRRDFTDVRDVAKAYAAAAEFGATGDVYNIASGSAHSLRELLTTLLERAQVEAEIVEQPSRKRANESPLLVGNAGKLRAASGWQPAISFEQSAADTLDWWRGQIRGAVAAEGTST